MDTQRDNIEKKMVYTKNGHAFMARLIKLDTEHNCQGISWWMKAAAKFATASFTSV
jgi:hypothetical protein